MKVLSIAAALVPSVLAVGKAIVVNNCDFDVSLWSVGSAVSDAHRLAAKSGTYKETFVKDPQTGGKALKITKEADGLYTGKPQTNFAYSLVDAEVWLDLSDVFGDPFKGHKLLVQSSDPGCGDISWPEGTVPAGSQVKKCSAASDATLTLCA